MRIAFKIHAARCFRDAERSARFTAQQVRDQEREHFEESVHDGWVFKSGIFELKEQVRVILRKRLLNKINGERTPVFGVLGVVKRHARGPHSKTNHIVGQS